ncbi:MAG TPA: hypothetical protein VGR19_00130 [Allosphingosinicella sp.]|nr:hypothetical protein [Allosphingosinicella sp.]
MVLMNAGLAALFIITFAGPHRPPVPAAPASADGFTRMFAAKQDQTWSGGDQTTSFKAPNGRVYWISADTIVSAGVDPDGSYPDSGTTMISNRLLLQNGGTLENAVANGGIAVPDPPTRTEENQDRYWPQGAFVANGHLYLLCQRVTKDPTPDTFGFKFSGTRLAKFRFGANGKLTFVKMVATPSTDIAGGTGAPHLQWAADAIEYGRHIYVYGYTHSEPGDPSGHYSYVARVPKDRVEEPGAWRFYRKSRRDWVRSMAQLSSARNNPDSILATQVASVRMIDGKIVIAHKPWQAFGSSVYAEVGLRPEGPFTRIKLFESPGGTWQGRRYFTYAPMLHPEQRLAGPEAGKTLLSINWNGPDFWTDVLSNAKLYKPRFHAVTLP